MQISPLAIIRMKTPRTVLSGFIALLMFLTCSLPAEARVNHKPGYNSFSPEQDIELGRDAVKEVEKELTLVNDQQLNDYISRLGQIGRAHV